jgi:tetratricopeptide (TPR) repeat protein
VRGAPAALSSRFAALQASFGILGVLLVGVAVVRPWLEVPLQTREKATAIRLVLAGLPSNKWVTYGAIAAALAGIAAAATAWRRGRASALLGLAGIAVLVLCGLLIAQLVLWDAGMRHTLVSQTLQKSVAVKQFGYSVRATQPAGIFLFPLTGVGKVIGGTLDHGFYLCALGGAVMTAAGFRPLLAAFRRHRRMAPLLATAATLAVVGTAAPGVVAWYVENSAAAAAQRGDTKAALSGLDLAVRLVPDFKLDPDYELARGTALLQAGDRNSAPALFVQSRNSAAAADRPRELALLVEAHRRAPGDTVVLEELRARAIDYASRIHDAAPLLSLGSKVGDDALVQYVAGRLYYDLGSFDAATMHFRRAEQLTPDPDVLSSAHTYVGLADLQLGRSDEAKRELVLAIQLDGTGSNGLARSTATGLYRGVLP